MAYSHNSLSIRQIEESLNDLRDVYAAKVMLNDAGDEIEEIHALASNARTPKRIVRDIESLLFVKFHTRVDYRRISLVQLSNDDLFSYFKRPKLVAVSQEDVNGELVINVRLAYADGMEAVGRAQAPSETADPCRLAAQAAIEALTSLAEPMHGLILEEVKLIGNSRTVAFVHLAQQTDRGREDLFGVSLAEPDVVKGSVRAALDAVNRRFF